MIGFHCPERPLAPVECDKDDIFFEARDWLVVVGDKDVVPALEMGIRFATVGTRGKQKYWVWSTSKYVHGPHGPYSSRIRRQSNDAPNNVLYEIQVRRIVSEAERDTLAFSLASAQSKKDIGNYVYQHEWPSAPSSDGETLGDTEVLPSATGDAQLHFQMQLEYAYQRARSLYHRGGQLAESVIQAVDEMRHAKQGEQSEEDETGVLIEEDEETKALYDNSVAVFIDCGNNMIATHLRAKQYHAAKEAAVNLLSKYPNNIKALTRAAKAALLDPASSFEEAEAALSAAEQQIKDDNSLEQDALRKLRRDLTKRKQSYKQQQKEMMARMAQATTTTANGTAADPVAANIREPKEVEEDKVEGVATEDDSEESQQEAITDGAMKPQGLSRLLSRDTLFNVVIPYGFQFMCTILMLWYFSYLKRQEANRMAVAFEATKGAAAAAVGAKQDNDFASEL
jgi:hypothetical protein